MMREGGLAYDDDEDEDEEDDDLDLAAVEVVDKLTPTADLFLIHLPLF